MPNVYLVLAVDERSPDTDRTYQCLATADTAEDALRKALMVSREDSQLLAFGSWSYLAGFALLPVGDLSPFQYAIDLHSNQRETDALLNCITSAVCAHMGIVDILP